jgi:hypothetical protein
MATSVAILTYKELKMIINYPKQKIDISNGILRIKAMLETNDVKSFAVNIPNNIRINNTSYGLDISGDDHNKVQSFGDMIIMNIKTMNN